MNKRRLDQDLRSRGCYLYRQQGPHEIWVNPDTERRAPIPKHRELKLGTALAICRQLKVPPPPFR